MLHFDCIKSWNVLVAPSTLIRINLKMHLSFSGLAYLYTVREFRSSKMVLFLKRSPEWRNLKTLARWCSVDSRKRTSFSTLTSNGHVISSTVLFRPLCSICLIIYLGQRRRFVFSFIRGRMDCEVITKTIPKQHWIGKILFLFGAKTPFSTLSVFSVDRARRFTAPLSMVFWRTTVWPNWLCFYRDSSKRKLYMINTKNRPWLACHFTTDAKRRPWQTARCLTDKSKKPWRVNHWQTCGRSRLWPPCPWGQTTNRYSVNHLFFLPS